MKTTHFCLLAVCFFHLCVSAQTQTSVGNSSEPVTAPPKALPLSAQLRKTVVFIKTNCLKEPTPDEIAALPEEQREKWKPESLAKLKPEELAKMEQFSMIGTGFFVFVPDERFGKDAGFDYLITNRHVAQPGIEDGKPCDVISHVVYLNHKGPKSGDPAYLQAVPINVPYGRLDSLWFFPEEGSVDLAAAQIRVSEASFDFEKIPLNLFADNGQLVEGDPVLFAGLFIQYSGQSRLEPIVRSGSIAMLPTDPMQTTLHKLGHVYLTEVHAFGGNSGSPIFADLNKFKNILGTDYRFMGVVTGEVFESNDLTFQVSTSYKGAVAANSDISIVVPAEEVRKLLLSPKLQAKRDNACCKKSP